MLISAGPEADLCLRLSTGYRFANDSLAILNPVGKSVQVRARLTRSIGGDIELGEPGLLSGGGRKEVCFRLNTESGNSYRELKLMASDTLTVAAIQWWSGKRMAAP
jgi:hypothetical protein